jgi:hypothetical protein
MKGGKCKGCSSEARYGALDLGVFCGVLCCCSLLLLR